MWRKRTERKPLLRMFVRWCHGGMRISWGVIGRAVQVLLLLGTLVLLFIEGQEGVSADETQARVVISEVMWMGSDLSTADEWVELTVVGTTASGADLSGWRLTSTNSTGEEATIVTFQTGATIATGEERIVSNYPLSSSRIATEPWIATTAMSLPNAKLLLKLYDGNGVVQDEVDDGVGVPFAGANPSGGGPKASMERIDLAGPGAVKENWRTATVSLGFKDGAPIFGTPGFPNDVISSSASASSTTSTTSTTSSWDSSSSSFLLSSSGASSSTGLGALSASSSSLSSVAFPSSSSYSSCSSSSSSSTTSIRITEILANPIGADDDEWIEIGNSGTGSVSIAGWSLGAGSHTYVIPRERTASGAFPPRTATGFSLQEGEYVSFRKSVTKIILSNDGADVSLSNSGTIIDTLTYPAAVEGVSFGRGRSFCIPTEGAPNVVMLLDPRIVVQSTSGTLTASGSIAGEGHVSVNLLVETATGSLTSAQCHWDYGDGYTSDSCNPPSHAFDQDGTFVIHLSIVAACGDTAERTIAVTVRPGSSKPHAGGGGNTFTLPVNCVPKEFGSGVVISEVLPDPFGDDEAGEWIELKNRTNETIRLCGWSVDDGEGGSNPFMLSHERIFPWEYLLLPRTETKIALNNDEDSVRLFGPGGFLAEEVTYERVVAGESLALRVDGQWVWTPYLTPGAGNAFRTAERRFPSNKVILSAALPNPEGKDDGKEWIEIMNMSAEEVSLDGWSLDDDEGGSKPFLLDGVRLKPLESQRFMVQETGLTLTNASGVARLLDPDGYVASVIGWTDAVEGEIYRPPHFVNDAVRARVVRVIDGDTFDVSFSDLTEEELRRLPSPVSRRWLALRDAGGTSLRVRLIGIDAPELHHPSLMVQRFAAESAEFLRALMEGQSVSLTFEEETFDRYGRLLAYADWEGSHSIEAELLRRGLAVAYTRFPFTREAEYRAYEAEAKLAKLGIWSDASVAAMLLGAKEETLPLDFLMEQGIALSVDPPPGLVSSGTVIRFSPSVSADLFLSVDSGAYVNFSGSTVLSSDAVLRAYAEVALADTGSVLHLFRSPVLEVAYVLERESYERGVFVHEVYPSPLKSDESFDSAQDRRSAVSDELMLTQEWLELFNPTGHTVPLTGWQLDDLRNGGSKPWTFPAGSVIASSAYLVLPQQQTGLKLNNDGDDVWLISPDASVTDHVTYPRMRPGISFSMVATGSGAEWCLSDPTPGEANHCLSLAHSSSSKERKQKARSENTTLAVKYRLAGSSSASGSGVALASMLQDLPFTIVQAGVLGEMRDAATSFPLVEAGVIGMAVIGSVILFFARGRG